MKIIPSYNTILISPEQTKDVVRGAFIEAVVTGKNQPEVGRVIAVGDFQPRWKGEDNPFEYFTEDGSMIRPDRPLVDRGDIIAYRRYGESKFFLKGKEYMFVSFDDVLGVIRLEEDNEPKNG